MTDYFQRDDSFGKAFLKITLELKTIYNLHLGSSKRRACAKALRLQAGAWHTQGAARPV